MNIYNINFSRLIKQLLPIAVRQPVIIALIKVLINPVIYVYNQFINYRNISLYKLNHTSQVCYMEAMLNDEFDSIFRRIKIGNSDYKEPIWFYEPEQDLEVWLDVDDPVYFDEPEAFGRSVDFIVFVPDVLQPASPEALNALIVKMSGLINYYKLFSKNYEIQWVSI
jgi:hypothetical protein